MHRFAFVILHYVTVDDTVRCVESIVSKFGPETADVVVVDNGSPNGTGAELKRQFDAAGRVRVILNARNLGFARGLNVGFAFAKRELGADFIALLNNDVVVESDDFVPAIVREYEREPFAVLGPDIVSTQTGKHQNPRKVFFDTPRKVRKNILFLCASFAFLFLGLGRVFDRLCGGLRRWAGRGREANRPPATPLAQKPSEGRLSSDWMLFGACWVFSPDYVRRFNGLYEGTFLYLEEEILSYLCRRHRLAMAYFPAVRVLHAERSSTRAAYASDRRQELLRCGNLVRSNRCLLRLMREGREAYAESAGPA